MTFLSFIKFACAAIFVTYLIAINQFKKEDKRSAGDRPRPEDYTFFPRKGRGLEKKELQQRFGSSAQKPGGAPATAAAPTADSGITIHAAKQRKLDRDAAKKNAP